MPATPSAVSLCQLIHGAKFHFTGELELQEGLARLLTGETIEFQREVRINAKDRLDFLVGDIGIEVKVDGSVSAVTRQLFRYAEKPEIAGLILVTTRAMHKRIPSSANGKPLYLVHLSALS